MKLTEMMEKAGLNRKKLAEIMDTTDVTIYRWEKNIHEPDHDTLRKLSQHLNCTIDELLANPTQPPVTMPEESGTERKTA